MGNSLQDQLLKAGLVNSQQLKKSKADKRKKQRVKSKKSERDNKEISLSQAYAQKAQQEKTDRDRELNRKREEQKRRQEINAQLKNIVPPKAQNKKDADVSRYFEHNGKIRKIYVTAEQQDKLNANKLGVVYVIGRYFLVDVETVEKVRTLKQEAVAIDPKAAKEAANPEYDDPKFEIPDDLTW